MATVSHDLGGNGICRYYLEYDDVTMWVLGLRCVTTSQRTGVADAVLVRESDGAEYVKSWSRNGDTRMTLQPATRTAERIQLEQRTKADGRTPYLAGFYLRRVTPGA